MSTALQISSYRMNVYEAINQVQLAMSRDGILKSRKNEQQGYAFRGIDDMYNALSIPLASFGLCIIPRFRNRAVTERTTQKGGVLFYVTIEGEFDLVGPDGSKHTAVAFGEAMDSGDKATNKAMSAAFKYMCMQLFCIPTEGDNDADSTTHNLQATVQELAQRRIAELKAQSPEPTYEERHKKMILEAAEILEQPASPKPARKRGDITYKALESFASMKKMLKTASDGTDALYYEALKAAGVEHADELDTKASKEVYKTMLAIHNRLKQDGALKLEVETHALRVGASEFARILGANGFSDIEEFLANANGAQVDGLLHDLKEAQ